MAGCGLGAVIVTGLIPSVAQGQADPVIHVMLQAGALVPVGSFESAGGVAELKPARVWGLEVRHELVGRQIGLVLRGDVTTSLGVDYSIAPDCSSLCGTKTSTYAYHAALDVDLRTRSHDRFVAYVQAGPGLRELLGFIGGDDLSAAAEPSTATIGMLHVNAGIEPVQGRLGIDFQIGAYAGRFNRSSVTDVIATAGVRF